MKDNSSHISATRQSRNSFYTKKRPSPHGIAKSRRSPSDIRLSAVASRKTPSYRLRAEFQAQRDLQALSLKRDGRLLEEEYRAEVLKYMYDMEQSTMSSASCMDQQPEIRWHMRPCLVDFLVEAHLVFKLRPETLYLTLNIIDRYCSRRVVYVKHFQLVGCAALWIASKFEDAKERVPTVQDLYELCNEAYDMTAFIQMEYHVLTTIQWIVGHPTAEAWLRIACCNLFVEDTKTGHVARFLMEITLFHREFIPFKPSATSGGALILAQYICDQPRRRTEEAEASLEVAELLDARLAHHLNDVSEILLKKYGYAFYSKASNVVVDFYLASRRFQRHPIIIPPSTPVKRGHGGIPPTPLSASTSCSSISSDDMPMTPTGGSFIDDPFVVIDTDNQKENNRPNNVPAEPLIKRPSLDAHLDANVFARPALQNLNGILPSPRTQIH